MSGSPVLTEIQEALLMAAYYEGARPGSRFRKCHDVIFQAMWIAGHLEAADPSVFEFSPMSAIVRKFYMELIRLIRHQPPEDALFWSMGNVGSESSPPADPPFTECCLSEAGAQLAEKLKEKHPSSMANRGGV
jgi:hypothetical protein